MKSNETPNGNLPTTYKILSLIEKGITTAPKLITISDSSKATIYRTLITLEKGYLITKLGKSPALYSATARGRIELNNIIKHTVSRTKSHNVSLPSLRVIQKKTRIHALAIKYPILENKFTGEWDKVVKSFKNSSKSYLFIPEGKVTIEKTSKSIILHIHKKTINKRELLTTYYEWLQSVTAFTYYFLLKKGIKFDHWRGKIIKQHIATESGQFEEKVEISPYEIGLGRKVKSYYPSNMDAKAWLDRSKGVLEIESNDLPYEEKLLLTPELVFETNNNISSLLGNFAVYNQGLAEYSKNIKLHISVMEGIEKSTALNVEVMNELQKTLKEMRNLKGVK